MLIYPNSFANRLFVVDALTQILDTLRLKSSVYCRSELGSPWGLHFAPRACAVFHVLHRGNGYVRLASDDTLLPLCKKDVLLLSGGDEHTLCETPTALLFRNLELDQWGECALMRWSDRPTAIVLCGTFAIEPRDCCRCCNRCPRSSIFRTAKPARLPACWP